jgi:hypothetical protein
MVYGNPFARTFDQTKTTMGAQPSTGQSLLSLGLTGLGLAGGFGGGNVFSQAGKGLGTLFGGAEGGSVGGLSGLPVVRRQMGSIGTDPEAFGEPINWREVDRTIGKYAGPPARYINKILTDLAGAPVDVVTQVLNKLGITSIDPSQAIGGSQSIKRGLRGGFGPKVLPPKTTQEIMATSSREPDLIVDQTAGVPELVEGGLEIEEPTREEIRDLKLEGLKKAEKEKEKIYAVDTFGEMPKKIESKQNKVSGLDLSTTSFLKSMMDNNQIFQDMVTDSVGNIQDLKLQLKDAQAADKKSTEDSRSKRNELNVMQAFLKAARAVATADPSRGFLNAAAVGASEGGNAFVEGRIKLEKEAAGDGKKAIDAIKTLLNVETADLKLQQAAMSSEANLLKAMADWAKANNIKTNPKTLNAAIQFIDKRSGISLSKFDPQATARWDVISAHVMTNLNNPEIWDNFPRSGKGFTNRAFSGNPDIDTKTAIKQLKGRSTVGATQG